jgi:tripartite ATP-independent transporter DctP family solute receptor
MKRIVAIIIMLAVFFVGIAVNAASEIKMQHNCSIQHPWQKGLEYMKDRVGKLSNGKMQATVYPNGMLAQNDWKVILEQTQRNVCQVTVESFISFANLNGKLFALNAPFLFDNWDHFRKFMAKRPAVVDKWFKELETKDIKVIAVWPRAPRQELNAVREIKTPEDMQGLKIRVPELNIFVKTFTTLGAKPVPLQPAEIYTAMQLGTIAGADNSIDALYDFKTHEVSKYLTKWDYMMDGVLVVVNKKWYDGLSKKEQRILTTAAAEASDVVYKAASKQQEIALNEMKKHGINVTEFTPAMKKPFKEKLGPIYKMMKETVGAKDWQSYLKAIEAAK